jgi:hypothetical protein
LKSRQPHGLSPRPEAHFQAFLSVAAKCKSLHEINGLNGKAKSFSIVEAGGLT